MATLPAPIWNLQSGRSRVCQPNWGWRRRPDRGIISLPFNNHKGGVMSLHDQTTSLHQRLRDARRERGLSLDALAARVGTSRARLGRIEAGRIQPDMPLLDSLSQALELPASELLDLLEDSQPAREVPTLRRYLHARYGFSLEETRQVQTLIERILRERVRHRRWLPTRHRQQHQ